MGLLAPRPRQHRMLHPKLRLTAQEKSNEKKIFCSAFSQKICASFMPEGQNLELNALCLRGGMGAAQAPIYNDSSRMCEAFMPARASLGMQHPMLPGAWGEQPHKINTRISTRARRNLGLNALRLRGGMGAA